MYDLSKDTIDIIEEQYQQDLARFGQDNKEPYMGINVQGIFSRLSKQLMEKGVELSQRELEQILEKLIQDGRIKYTCYPPFPRDIYYTSNKAKTINR